MSYLKGVLLLAGVACFLISVWTRPVALWEQWALAGGVFLGCRMFIAMVEA